MHHSRLWEECNTLPPPSLRTQAGGWDPFGNDPPPLAAAAAAAPIISPLKPARPPPPAPKPKALPAAASPAAAAAADDPFDLFTTSASTGSTSSAAATASAPPPSYVAAAGLPPPPSYEASAAAPAAPPPPYGAALELLGPPPSYEELFASTSSLASSSLGGSSSSSAAVVTAAAAVAVAPGPLTAGLVPARKAPAPPPSQAAPQPRQQQPAGGSPVMPARPAPAAPPRPTGGAGNISSSSGSSSTGSGSGSGPIPTRAAPKQPPVANPFAAALGAGEPPGWVARSSAAQEALRDLSLVDDSSDDVGDEVTPGGLLGYETSGGATSNDGACPAASPAAAGFGSDLCAGRAECRPLSVAARTGGERQLSAHLRLAPLRPKEAAPIKRLVTCGGSLFAAPAGEGAQMLQWALSQALEGGAGSTLPSGAKR